jgi:hypothetical protein
MLKVGFSTSAKFAVTLKLEVMMNWRAAALVVMSPVQPYEMKPGGRFGGERVRVAQVEQLSVGRA